MGYHFHVDFISRGKGQSLVAKGAYQARAKFREERTGEYKDYTHKPDGPVKTFVFVDKKHGPELQNVETLLNAIDRAETKANSQTGLNFTAALPKELTDEDRARMVRDFGREHFLRKGIPAIAHIHPPHEQAPAPGQAREKDDHEADELHNGNWHVHMIAATRILEPDGQFHEKHITWDSYRDFLEHKRERWAELGARYLENAGFKIEAERWRYGHLTNPQQREKALERGDHEWAERKGQEAGKHRGPNADAMERKGIETDLGNASREIQQRNEDRAQLRMLRRDLAKLERADAFDKLKHELTEADKVLAETRRAERDYARRDPVREQIAWEDKLAGAAIEKEKKERQFVENPRAGRSGAEQKHEPARPRFGDVLITRAAGAAMHDPRQQHGEPLSSLAAFKDALEKNRLGLACVTPEEAVKSHREKEFAKAVGRYAPAYQAGEIVIVREPRTEGNSGRRVLKLDQTKAEDYLCCLALDKNQLQGIEATKEELDDRAQMRERSIKAARTRFGDMLITRAADTAMNDPRQQHGEPVSPAAFKDALEKNRFGLACVTAEEAAKSHREKEFAKAVGRYAPVYQAGEIVIVREPRTDGNSGGQVHRLDQTKAEDYLRCLALDKSQLQGIEATKQALDERAQNRQRQIDAAKMRKARGPRRSGLVGQQMWALQRLRDAEQQRRAQDRREYTEKQKRDGAEIDPERYRTDPEYRRHAQNAQAYKSPDEKKRDRENDVRAIMEQQDRGGRR